MLYNVIAVDQNYMAAVQYFFTLKFRERMMRCSDKTLGFGIHAGRRMHRMKRCRIRMI